MRKRAYAMLALMVVMVGPGLLATAQGPADSKGVSASEKTAATHRADNVSQGTDKTTDEAAQRIEGEKRFRTNCGRCHMPPHKFPPRVMATAIRHMRIRAMLTEEDMRLILKYMTQ